MRKSQSIPPKVARDAATFQPGDRVNSCVRSEGEVPTEAVPPLRNDQNYNRKLKMMSRRRPIRNLSTEDVMRMTRGED